MLFYGGYQEFRTIDKWVHNQQQSHNINLFSIPQCENRENTNRQCANSFYFILKIMASQRKDLQYRKFYCESKSEWVFRPKCERDGNAKICYFCMSLTSCSFVELASLYHFALYLKRAWTRYFMKNAENSVLELIRYLGLKLRTKPSPDVRSVNPLNSFKNKIRSCDIASLLDLEAEAVPFVPLSFMWSS